MDIQEQRWNDAEAEKAFKEFQRARDPVLRVTQKLFANFYREHFSGNETVLEVGAGKGFLITNFPKEFNGRWIQLDLEEILLENVIGEKIVGNVYELPFPDKSFDVVCGIGSFDVFYDLEKAVAESTRVLKDSGFFFHFLDIGPNTEVVLYDLEQRGKLFFPEDLGLIFLIPDENREAFEKVMKENRSLGYKKSDWEIKKAHGDFLDQEEYFRKRLTDALARYFNNVNSGTIASHFTGEKLPIHKESVWSTFANLSGSPICLLSGTKYAHLDPLDKLPENHCVEVSEIHYVIAKNPHFY